MCKPSPGPRCSNHTKEDYRHKRQALLNAVALVRASEDDLLTVENDNRATTHQVRQAKMKMEQSLENLHEAEEAEKVALKAWYSSPDGQRFLSTKVETATDENQKQKWQELLTEAQETRRYQNQAQELVNRTKRTLDSLPPDSPAAVELNSVTEEGKKASVELEKKEEEIISFNKELVAKERAANEAISAVNSHRAYVKRHQDAVSRIIYQSYLDEGVDSTLAKHYTLDSISTFQSGWAYLSDNSPDRVPQYGGRFEMKTKEMDAKTNFAAENVWTKDGFREAYDIVKAHQDEYMESIPVAQQANKELLEARVQMRDLLSEREDIVNKRDSLRQHYNVLRAGYGGGTQQVEHYDVPFSQFVKSTYVNSDGKTNAFVFSDSLNQKVPVFSRVEEVKKDSRGNQFVVTNAGEKLYADDLKSRQLRLLRPENGSSRLFGRKS